MLAPAKYWSLAAKAQLCSTTPGYGMEPIGIRWGVGPPQFSPIALRDSKLHRLIHPLLSFRILCLTLRTNCLGGETTVMDNLGMERQPAGQVRSWMELLTFEAGGKLRPWPFVRMEAFGN